MYVTLNHLSSRRRIEVIFISISDFQLLILVPKTVHRSITQLAAERMLFTKNTS